MVRIKNRRRPQAIRQSGQIMRRVVSGRGSLPPQWGVVTDRQHSEDNSVDVQLRNGMILRHVGIRSLEWGGYNSTTGFGEQDLPPEGAQVLVLFPDNLIEEAFILCSRLDQLGDYGDEQESAGLLGSGQERTKTKVNEIGWKETYDKDAGDFTLESPSGDSNTIVLKASRTAEEVEITVGTRTFKVKKDGFSMIGSGATISVSSLGAITITAATGQNITLNSGVINCNNFPACLFTGAPHSTAMFTKV